MPVKLILRLALTIKVRLGNALVQHLNLIASGGMTLVADSTKDNESLVKGPGCR